MRQAQAPRPVSNLLWSPAATIEHFGGDEALVRELVGLFLGSCPRLMDNLRTRLRDNDLVGLGRAAHALKGSISNFTREVPATTALELERLCGQNQRDAAIATLQRLEQEMSRLLAEMKAFHRG
jgi:HPt (histidine-containing phosphotransfer) domain-containing protein